MIFQWWRDYLFAKAEGWGKLIHKTLANYNIYIFYLWIFYRVCFLMNIFGKESDLPWLFTQEASHPFINVHEQNVIGSQTQLNDIAYEHTIISRQLFAGLMVDSRPMKRKKNLHQMINNFSVFFSNMHAYHHPMWSNMIDCYFELSMCIALLLDRPWPFQGWHLTVSYLDSLGTAAKIFVLEQCPVRQSTKIMIIQCNQKFQYVWLKNLYYL